MDWVTRMERRLSAMKHFQPRSNARTAVTALALAGISLLAGVPWRVVAQEAAPPSPATPAPPAARAKAGPEARLAQAQAEADVARARAVVMQAEASLKQAEARLRQAKQALEDAAARAQAVPGLPGAPPANERDTPSARALAEMRLAAARKMYEGAMERMRLGASVSNEYLYLWSRRWLDAERAVSRTAAERRDAAAGHLKRMQPLDDLAKRRVKVGDLSVAELPETEFYRVEAELWLAEERAAGASPAGVPTRPEPAPGAGPR